MSRDAPQFKSDEPGGLIHFLRIYQRLADEAGLSIADKITRLIEYIPPNEAQLWSDCSAFTNPVDWDAFKKEIYDFYPGCEDARRFGIEDLVRFRDTTRQSVIDTLWAWGEFHREFLRISGWLKKENLIGDLELQRHFWDAIPETLQIIVGDRLRVKFPDHRRSMPHNIKTIYEAAIFSLDATSTTKPPTFTPAVIPTTATPPPGPSYGGQGTWPRSQESNAVVKTEVFNGADDTITRLLSELLQQRTRTHQSSSPATGANQTTQQFPRTSAPGNALCYVCGLGGHILSSCPVTLRLVHERKVRFNGWHRLEMPDSSRIPGTTPWVDGIEQWHAENPGKLAPLRDTPPHQSGNISANFFEPVVAPGPSPHTASISSAPDDEDPDILSMRAHILLFQGKLAEKEKAVAESRKQAPSPQLVSAAAQATLPRTSSAQVLAGSAAPPTAPQAPAASRFQIPASTPNTQFRYESPVEKPEEFDGILTRVLDTQTFLSVRELLSLSPASRKYFADLVRPRRIPTTGASTLFAEEEAAFGNLYCNDHSPSRSGAPWVEGENLQPLRTIDVTINGHPIVGILDGGCQVVIIREDVWTRLAIPLDPSRILTMESADSSISDTIGVLPRVTFIVGEDGHSVALTLPVQVVRQAPFECLLGRPFMTLAEAETKDLRDGGCHITLFDPNTKLSIRIPTRERVRETPACLPTTPGF